MKLNLRAEIKKLLAAFPEPVTLGAYTSYQHPLQWLTRALAGSPEHLGFLRLHPDQPGLAPGSKDRLLEVVRALWPEGATMPVTPEPEVIDLAEQEERRLERAAPKPEPAPVPQAEPAKPEPQPAITNGQAWLELLNLMGDEVDRRDHATGFGATTMFMDQQKFYRPPDLTVTEQMRKPGVVFIRAKAQKLVFQNGNSRFEANPSVRQPQEAPAWIKGTPTWDYAIRAGFLEEV